MPSKPHAGTAHAGKRLLLFGALVLTLGVALYVLHGLMLMDYEDRLGGVGAPETESAWVASLPAGLRLAYRTTAVAAPASLLIGLALVATGLRRVIRQRRSAV